MFFLFIFHVQKIFKPKLDFLFSFLLHILPTTLGVESSLAMLLKLMLELHHVYNFLIFL
jgi:hypothetical protein